MALSQKVNHFPGMFNVYRKNYLANNMERMRKAYPQEYSFFPRTYVLPNELPELLSAMKVHAPDDDDQVYIAKPCDQSQGKGIFLVTSPQDLPCKEKMVVQKYISR